MLSSIIQLLQTGLSLWEHHEKTKYIDKVIQLKKRYRDEESKPENERSGAVLDNIEFELRLISAAFCAAAQKPNTISG